MILFSIDFAIDLVLGFWLHAIKMSKNFYISYSVTELLAKAEYIMQIFHIVCI